MGQKAVTMLWYEARDDNGLNQDDNSRGGDKWPDCGYILKVESPGFADRFYLG